VLEWTNIGQGAHGSIRKARIRWGGNESCVCLKLFTDEWKAAYERESWSYEVLQFRGVERCIPDVYWKGSFPASKWGNTGSHSGEEEPILHGIVMEFLEDCREIEFSRVKMPMGLQIARALRNVHKAHIRHGDTDENNLLIVRDTNKLRPVWIDFSCAWVLVSRKTLDTEYGDFVAEMLNKMVAPFKLGLSALGYNLYPSSRVRGDVRAASL
jgi:hypothetical protein